MNSGSKKIYCFARYYVRIAVPHCYPELHAVVKYFSSRSWNQVLLLHESKENNDQMQSKYTLHTVIHLLNAFRISQEEDGTQFCC